MKSTEGPEVDKSSDVDNDRLSSLKSVLDNVQQQLNTVGKELLVEASKRKEKEKGKRK